MCVCIEKQARLLIRRHLRSSRITKLLCCRCKARVIALSEANGRVSRQISETPCFARASSGVFFSCRLFNINILSHTHVSSPLSIQLTIPGLILSRSRGPLSWSTPSLATLARIIFSLIFPNSKADSGFPSFLSSFSLINQLHSTHHKNVSHGVRERERSLRR